MKIAIIAAVGINMELGKGNDLLWKIPEDLKNFKNITKDSHLLMGRKTFDSLPGVLPGRKHFVLTRDVFIWHENKDVLYFDDMAGMIELAKEHKQLEDRGETDTFFIIGGANIYEQTMKDADELHISHIEAQDSNADVYFPEIDMNVWKMRASKHFEAIDESPAWTYVIYDRV